MSDPAVAPPRTTGATQPADAGPPIDVHVSGAGNVYMTEIAEQLVDACPASREARLRIDELPASDGRIHLVVAPHEFYPLHPEQDPDVLAAAAAAATGLNTEQPGSPWFEIAATWCRHGAATLDINARGARALEEAGIPAWHLPLGYTEERDRWGGTHADRALDLTYLGDDSPRRLEFLGRHAALLADLRCEVRVFRSDRAVRPGRRGFLDRSARLDLLSRSRVLLNIHRGEQPYFEWVRVLDAMANGCVVVSETSTDTGPLAPGLHFLEAPLEHLMEVAAGLLDAEPLRRRIADAAHEALREQLALPRLLEAALEHLPPPRRTAAPATPRKSRQPLSTGLSDGREIASGAGGDGPRGAGRPVARRHLTTSVHWGRLDPAVSIVVLVRDHASTVAGAVAAALRSAALVDGEVVVVDRGSIDRSRNIVEGLLAAHPGAGMAVVGLSRSATLGDALGSVADVARGSRVLVVDGGTELGATAVQEMLRRDPGGVAVAMVGVAADPPTLAHHVAEDLDAISPATTVPPVVLAEPGIPASTAGKSASSLVGAVSAAGITIEHLPLIAGVYRPPASTCTSTPR